MEEPLKEFSGKSAIVTGATSGIGQDIAETLHKMGAKIIISGRDLDRGSQLEDQLYPKAHFIKGDIKDPKVNQNLAESAYDRFGRLDMLVLSAGYLGIGKRALRALSAKFHDLGY